MCQRWLPLKRIARNGNGNFRGEEMLQQILVLAAVVAAMATSTVAKGQVIAIHAVGTFSGVSDTGIFGRSGVPLVDAPFVFDGLFLPRGGSGDPGPCMDGGGCCTPTGCYAENLSPPPRSLSGILKLPEVTRLYGDVYSYAVSNASPSLAFFNFFMQTRVEGEDQFALRLMLFRDDLEVPFRFDELGSPDNSCVGAVTCAGDVLLHGRQIATLRLSELYFTKLTAVPEPSAWSLMIGGFGVGCIALRRRRSRATAEDWVALRVVVAIMVLGLGAVGLMTRRGQRMPASLRTAARGGQ